MKSVHIPGEYQPQITTHPKVSGAHIPIDSVDIPMGYASRLWVKLTPGGIHRRVDDISKRFTGAGWKSLPQELVDEILGLLLDDLDVLKACSLTCKRLFGAARPLIHQRLICLDTRPDYPKPKRSLFSRRGRHPGAFGRLVDADRSDVLRYTRHLTFKPTDNLSKPCFNPIHLQGYLPQLRSITKLDSLTLEIFYITSFIPVFDEYFGIFANTLRRLDIRRADGTAQAILYIVSKFPLLEDLTIISSGGGFTPPVPAIAPSPPFRGKLVLANARSRELSEGLAAFPGGLNFRSLELAKCERPQAVLVACGHTATSISYLWPRGCYRSK